MSAWKDVSKLVTAKFGNEDARTLAGYEKLGGYQVLPKARGRADVELLDHYLSALEVANGIEQGSTRVIVLVTETAAAMFTTGSYAGAPRVVAHSSASRRSST